MIGRMCVYLTKGSYTQCQKHLLVIQLVLMHVQIKPTQQLLADVVVVLCCVNSTIGAKELFSVHQTNTTEKLSLLENAFLFCVSRNALQHFFGLNTKILSLCQSNDQARKIRTIIAYIHDFERENIHSISNIEHEKGGS